MFQLVMCFAELLQVARIVVFCDGKGQFVVDDLRGVVAVGGRAFEALV